MRVWLAAFLAVALAACVSLVPDDYDRMLGSAVIMEGGGGHGSGTVIWPNLVLTAGHIPDVPGMQVRFHDGDTRKAMVVWRSTDMDMALWSFDGEPMAYMPIDCSPLEIGEPFSWIGNPAIVRFNLMRGFVSSLVPVEYDYEWIRLMVVVSALFNPGDSGSGIFDDDGEIRGIVTGAVISRINGSSSQSGNGLVLPASAFCPELKEQGLFPE